MTPCTCSQIMLGTRPSGSLNLDPDCPQHGYDSPWYNSPEQVKRRAERSERLRSFYEAKKTLRSQP